ncbi:porin family protein [Hymenobacter coccineus]|nr:porin family protein [Hymenobacter coccineus]
MALPFAGQAQQRRRPAKASRSRGGNLKGVTVANLSNYDDRWFHPGLYFAPGFSRFFIEQSATYIQRQALTANSIISPDFGVGIIGDARLGNSSSPFILRFAPGVNFRTRRIEFKPHNLTPPDSVFTQEVSSTVVDFPLLLKYQSKRRGNTRMYMIAGVKPSVSVTTRRSDLLRNKVQVNDNDLTLEYGVGLDLFYPLFKFAPELRFSHGLRNLLVDRPDLYSRSLQSVRTNTVTLYLNIQN